MPPEMKLDTAESAFFSRELESIDTRVYEEIYPALKARELLPSVTGLDQFARVYTYRESKLYGKAKVISNMADDAPAVDVSATETSLMIKHLADSYNYDIFEIKAANREGRQLDRARALAARFVIETEIDDILGTGLASHGLKGLLNLTGTQTYTPSTKDAGGTAWGTKTNPIATAAEMANDLLGFAAALVDSTKQRFNNFTIVMPVEQYTLASLTPMNLGSDTTVLEFVLKTGRNAGFIKEIIPWYKCDGAGGGGDDRMVAYAKQEHVIASILPFDFTPQAPQLRNFAWVVNNIAACGGVVCRYPIAVSYCDGI